MPNRSDRPRFLEPSKRPQTPEEAQARRATTMLTLGAIALIVGLLALNAGRTAGLLVGILGVGLVVGGLVVRSL